jgi:Domain of unknown function (DUF4357)
MANGRVVQFFFADGDPDGLLICDEANRTARLIRIPRNKLIEALKRDDLKDRVATYLLIAENQDAPDLPYVYVGESEDVGVRLQKHMTDFPSFAWTHAVVVVSQSEALNKAHVKYLERLWHDILIKNDRCLISQNIPQAAKLTESERAILDDFSLTGQFLLGALGYSFFEASKVKITPAASKDIPRFRMITHVNNGFLAYGKPSGDGFLVEKGSFLDPEMKPSTAEYWQPVRDNLLEKNIIGVRDGKLQFLENWIANSPSRASSVVYGGSSNGRSFWRTETENKSLADWQAETNLQK